MGLGCRVSPFTEFGTDPFNRGLGSAFSSGLFASSMNSNNTYGPGASEEHVSSCRSHCVDCMVSGLFIYSRLLSMIILYIRLPIKFR